MPDGDTGSRRRRPSSAPVATFASLHIRNYRLYFVGQSVSVAGTWMQNVAIGWLVLQLSASGIVLGAVIGARFAPMVLLGPWGGLIADRYDTRRLMLITQNTSAALSVLLGVLAATNLVSVPVLFALVIALGLVNVVDSPARQSLIGSLVDRDRLPNAIALNSIAINVARVLGPGAAGILVATLGLTACFFINAASFAVVIWSLLAMRVSEIAPTERAAGTKGEIRAGLRYVVRTPNLAGPIIMITLAGIFAWEFQVTLPLVMSGTFHGDAGAYGLAMSCLGAGSIVGGLFAARRGHSRITTLATSSALWGTAILAAAAAPTILTEYLMLALVGSGAVTFNSMAKTLLQSESVPSMRGRVMALWSIAWQGSALVGAPIVGTVGAVWGPRYSLGIGGVATVLTGSLYLVRDRLGRSAPAIEAAIEPGAAKSGTPPVP